MQEKENIKAIIKECFENTAGNIVKIEEMDNKEIKIYDDILIGFSSAEDPLYEEFKKPGIIGPWYSTPKEWLINAKSVVSIFFSYSEDVKEANRKECNHASYEWAYARIEGQKFISDCLVNILEKLKALDIDVVSPLHSKDFFTIVGGKVISEKIKPEDDPLKFSLLSPEVFASNWSERHAAYVSGLGTFSVSRGLITKKGMAGRFGSLILSKEVEADERPYTRYDEYCIKCYACEKRCPAKAIKTGEEKDHRICAPFLATSKEYVAPRYGCGLCQTKVPCESKRP